MIVRKLANRRMAGALLGLTFLFGRGLTGNLLAQEHPAEKKEKIKIPATLKEIWAAVKAEQQKLHQTVAAKKLADVHLIAFAIRDYVAAMPQKAPVLPKDKQAALAKSVTLVARLASLLDEAGDAGDSAKTAGLVTRLDKELSKIEALYPAKMLRAANSPTDAGRGVVYACTMHPEVTSAKPGKCSQCGMELVHKSDQHQDGK